MKEANELAGKTKEEPPALSTGDHENKQLEDRRKELRKKENSSERKKVEYKELITTVKKRQTKITKETNRSC